MSTTIGTFTEQADGSYKGMFRTLSVNAELHIAPTQQTSQKAPNFRVFTSHGFEIGAGWTQIAKDSGNTWMSVRIEVPEFGPNPLYTRLVKDARNDAGTAYILYWDAKGVTKD
jgi:uncharacterized protein (DUF736 family)